MYTNANFIVFSLVLPTLTVTYWNYYNNFKSKAMLG